MAVHHQAKPPSGLCSIGVLQLKGRSVEALGVPKSPGY
jgi:hypothetical protein